jgi:hypothetical protein
MDNGKFGPPIGPSKSADDRFGYFGGTASPPLPPAVNQFGGTSAPSADKLAGAPPSPFGGTTTIQPTPVAAFAPTGRRRPGWLPLAVVGVLVALLAGGGWWWLHRDSIVLPDQLGALSRNSAFDSGAITGQMTFQTGNGDIKEELAGYGPSPVSTVLIVARGPGLADAIKARDQSVKGVEQIGPATCFAAKSIAICTRSEGDLSIVMETTGPLATTEETAGLLQEAWAAQ